MWQMGEKGSKRTRVDARPRVLARVREYLPPSLHPSLPSRLSPSLPTSLPLSFPLPLPLPLSHPLSLPLPLLRAIPPPPLSLTHTHTRNQRRLDRVRRCINPSVWSADRRIRCTGCERWIRGVSFACNERWFGIWIQQQCVWGRRGKCFCRIYFGSCRACIR